MNQQALAFAERWRQKGQCYSIDDKESSPANFFDRFFTAFVLYNFLYNEINRVYGLRLRGDKNKAATAAKHLLTGIAILDDEVIRRCCDEIFRLIERREFYIWNRENDYRSEPVVALQSLDSDIRIDGLLEIIYGIRCNMFHGEEEFVDSQKKILKPCIYVVEKLNELLIAKLRNDAAESEISSPRCN